MACIVGAESYLTLMSENDWGQFPGQSGSGSVGTYVHAPVNSYTVRAQRLVRNSQAYTGTHQRKHASTFGANVAGQLVTHLHGWRPSGLSISLAEYMMNWAFLTPEAEEPASKSAEWAEGPNVTNRRHTGLRVNTATLNAAADSGEILLTYDLIGKEEFSLTTAQTLPDDREKILDMQVFDMTLSLGGVTVPVSTLQHQLNNNLLPLRVNSWWIHALCKGMRDETLTVTIPKENATYDNYLRLNGSDTEIVATLTMRGLHNGTGGGGSWTKLTRVFNRLFFQNQDLAGDKGHLLQPLTFQCLKPDTTSNTFTDTWSEE